MMKDIQILKDVLYIDNQRYHSDGDFSATDIIDPYRLVCLKKRYANEIEQKVENQIDALMGTAMHALFEKNLKAYQAFDPKYELEGQAMMEIEIGGKKVKLAGRYDVLYNRQDIIDIKTAKVWKKIFDPTLASWTEQQNIYAYLLNHNGYAIRSVSALVMYKDWSAMQALRDKAYPREPMVMEPLELWEPQMQEHYITERLTKHVECESMSDNELPPCTTEERWERFSTGCAVQFALFKNPKAKRATKILHDATDLATAVVQATAVKGVTAASFIEIRHAERKRCERYCPVNFVCDEYARYMAAKNTNDLNQKYPLAGCI